MRSYSLYVVIACVANLAALFASPMIEVRTGYFFFESNDMQKVYNRGGFTIEGLGVCPVWGWQNVSQEIAYNRWIELTAGAGYIQKKGRSLNDHQPTEVSIVPISLGARIHLEWIHRRAGFYAGIGPRYFFAFQHNHSSFVPQKVRGNNIGFFIDTGLLFYLTHKLALDLFGEYSYGKLSFDGQARRQVEGHTAQIGGFSFGGGLAYVF